MLQASNAVEQYSSPAYRRRRFKKQAGRGGGGKQCKTYYESACTTR